MRFGVKIASILLIAFVLVGSKGLEVYKSFCKETQQTQFLLVPHVDPCEHDNVKIKHSCCERKEKPTPKKQKCCDEKEITLKLHFPYSIEKTVISFQQVTFLPIASLFSFPTKIACRQTHHRIEFIPPPRPSGRQQLLLLSTWRI